MKTGFLGGGNMGGALIDGLLRSGAGDALYAYDLSEGVRAALAAKGVNVVSDAVELFDSCDAVVLCVKPQVLQAAVEPCAARLGGKLVISIAAGWTLARLYALLPEDARVLRVMPNTPALVGCGMSALCAAERLTDADKQTAETIFSAVGEYIWTDEHAMDAVTGVSGSGAAYVYMFIDAMAQGGVRMGLRRDVAQKLAAQTVLGAAEMVIKTGRHPAELRDAVCSPAGTTIEAVRLLEERAMPAAVMDAVITCAEKSKEMSASK